MPLDSYPLLRTNNIEDVQRMFGTSVRVQIAERQGGKAAPEMLLNRADLPMTAIWYCSYGVPIKLDFAEGDILRIQFWRSGHGATVVDGERVAVTPQQACVMSVVTSQFEADFAADYTQLALNIDAGAIERKLEALIDRPVVHRLACEPAMDLRTPESGHMRRALDFLVQCLDSREPGWQPLALAEMAQALVVSLLCATRHNYSDLLQRQPSDAAPWQLRRVEEFIEANWNRPIKIEDLAAIVGTSARSLFRSFRQNRGYSPMEFTKRVRLQQARRLLKAPDATTVTEVAFACGFGDLGRFSRDYRREFGELPSRAFDRGRPARA